MGLPYKRAVYPHLPSYPKLGNGDGDRAYSHSLSPIIPMFLLYMLSSGCKDDTWIVLPSRQRKQMEEPKNCKKGEEKIKEGPNAQTENGHDAGKDGDH